MRTHLVILCGAGLQVKGTITKYDPEVQDKLYKRIYPFIITYLQIAEESAWTGDNRIGVSSLLSVTP